MNLTKKDFLSFVTRPAWLGINEAASLPHFNEHDILVLVSARLLKPPGRPLSTGSKFFAAVQLQALRSDRQWLAKAFDPIVNYWRTKNSGRRNKVGTQLAVAA